MKQAITVKGVFSKMAQNAHIINNPMDVIQADETADIAIANGYITPVDISER